MRDPRLAKLVFPAVCVTVIGGLWLVGPGDDQTAGALQTVPRALALTLVLVAVAAGLGERVLVGLGVHPPSRAQHVAYAVGLGLGALSVAVMALTALGVLSRHSLAALLVAASILAPARRSAGDLWGGFRDVARRRYDSIGTGILLGVLAVMAISYVALGVCHPTDTDSLRYHLRLPELYLSSHGFQYPERNHFAQMPLAAEMLYAVGLAFAGGSGASMVVAIAGLTCLLGIYAFAASRFSPAAGITGAGIFATTGLVACLFGTATVDLLVCLYVVLGVGAVLNHDVAREQRWLLLAGICGGLATSVKLSGAYSTGLIALWAAVSTGSRRGALWRFVTVAVPAGLVVSPWIIKTAVVTGNPLFPLFPETLGGRNWRPEYTVNYMRELGAYGRHGWLGYLLSPLWLTIWWREYGSPVPLSPIYLVLLLGLPMLGRQGRPAWPIVAWCAGFLCFWLATAQVARFVLPGLAVLSIALGFVGTRASPTPTGRTIFVPAYLSLMIVGMGLWALGLQWTHFGYWRYLSGRVSQAEYIAEYADYYPVVLYADRSLPAGSRILFVGETLAYGLQVPALVETGFAGVSAIEWANEAANARELARRVMANGFTHLIVDKRASEEPWARRLNYFAWRDQYASARFNALLRHHCRPVYAHGGVCLYELRVAGAGREPQG